MISEPAAFEKVPEEFGRIRAMIAGALATAFETYDFVVYGYVAAAIGNSFFPSNERVSSLLASFSVFGVGFLMRPFGGVLIGRLADLRGRKPALAFSIALMALATLIIGLLPSYKDIGAAAPVFLVGARLLQGIAFGGAAASGMTFVVEWARPDRRGLFGAIQQSGGAIGALTGSAIAALCASSMSQAQFDAIGWRIPYVIGALILPLAFFFRRDVSETPIFNNPPGQSTGKEKAILTRLMQAIGLVMLWTSATYILFSFMPSFTKEYAFLTTGASLWSNSIGLLALVLSMPVFGYLSDKVGRRPILFFVSCGFAVLPVFLLELVVFSASFGGTVFAQIVFGVMLGALFGVCPATLSEIFSTKNRTMYVSVSYGLAVAIVGGFAPYIAILLIKGTGSPLAPALYIAGNALVTGIVAVSLPETSKLPLG